MPAFGESHVGRRENNEDSFRVREDLGLYLVADGMGGHEGGEIASRVVADMLTDFFSREATQPVIPIVGPAGDGLRRRMTHAIAAACSEVERLATGDLAQMGTTLAALVLQGDVALVAHVGDSRVYRLRDARFERLTDDHSFVGELEQAGALDLLATLPYQFSAMVTRCIAAEANAEPDIVALEARAGDVFLLCSDGLTDVLTDATIGATLAEHTDSDEASRALVRLAYESGGQDNITCVVVHA